MYKLQLEFSVALIGSIDNRDQNELWHKRMGHLHYGALRILKNTVIGALELSTKKGEVCRGCVLGKYAKATFPRSNDRAKGALELINFDICGPMSTTALSGAKYFATFIDDYSRKTWIYFLKTKYEVFNRFKDFKALVENSTG